MEGVGSNGSTTEMMRGIEKRHGYLWVSTDYIARRFTKVL
jgi:hypothetical protein